LIVLDTDILVNILRKKNRGEQWKDFLKDKSIAFTTITAFELFLGAEISKKSDQNMKAIKSLVQQFPVLPLSIKSAYIAATIYSDFQKKGQMIELNHIYIAAITLEHGAELATDNVNHYQRVSLLKIINI
jgi:predicted nucleic acid-binding protein